MFPLILQNTWIPNTKAVGSSSDIVNKKIEIKCEKFSRFIGIVSFIGTKNYFLQLLSVGPWNEFVLKLHS